MLDVDSEESYQLMVHWLEDSQPIGWWLLALSSGLLDLIPSLGAPLFLAVPRGTPIGLRRVDVWSGLLECGLTPCPMVATDAGRSLSIGVLSRDRWIGAQRRRAPYLIGLRVSLGFISSRIRSFFGFGVYWFSEDPDQGFLF